LYLRIPVEEGQSSLSKMALYTQLSKIKFFIFGVAEVCSRSVPGNTVQAHFIVIRKFFGHFSATFASGWWMGHPYAKKGSRLPSPPFIGPLPRFFPSYGNINQYSSVWLRGAPAGGSPSARHPWGYPLRGRAYGATPHFLFNNRISDRCRFEVRIAY